jgi:hypothetical protein
LIVKQIGGKKVTLSLALAFISFLSIVPEESLSNSPNFRQLIAGVGSPKRTRPFGARGCPATSGYTPLLVTLAPPMETYDPTLVFTVSDRPTFWFYMSDMPPTSTAEFILQNQNDKNIYQGNFLLPKESGLVSLTLPSQKKYSLETEKKYRWYIKVYCNPSISTERYIFDSGWVQRKALSLPQDYAVYDSNGIWYDKVTNLVDKYRRNPKNTQLKKDWATMLQSVGLDETSQSTLLNCCKLPDNQSQLPIKTKADQ